MRRSVNEELNFSQRSLMSFAQGARRNMPKKCAMRAIHIPAEKGGPAFTVGQEFINPRSALAQIAGVRMQFTENAWLGFFSGVIALGIGAGKKPWQPTKEHVQSRGQKDSLIATSPGICRKGQKRSGRSPPLRMIWE
jgi:hypothetical protein